MPLTQTSSLLTTYFDDLYVNSISDDQLKCLLSATTFTRSPGLYDPSAPISDTNHSKTDAMRDFVQTLGDRISPEILHALTKRMLGLTPNGMSKWFLHKANLAKIFLCYEMATHPETAADHFLSEPFTSLFPTNDDLIAFKSNTLQPSVIHFRKQQKSKGLIPSSSLTSQSYPTLLSPASSSSPSQRSIALLDVDYTLLFHVDSLNEELVSSLLRHRIRDIFLFTDMVFNHPGIINERLNLITTLEKRGFTVHGTITPNDIFWSQLRQDQEDENMIEVNKFHDALFKGSYHGKFSGELFEQFLLEIFPGFPEIKAMLDDYIPEGQLGEAFQSVSSITSSEALEPFRIRSLVAKVMAEIIQVKRGMPHSKGLMLELFLRHKPDWVNRIIVADDLKDVIDTVNLFTSNPTPIITLHVTSQFMGKHFYDNAIKPRIIRSGSTPESDKRRQFMSFHRSQSGSTVGSSSDPSGLLLRKQTPDSLQAALIKIIDNYLTRSPNFFKRLISSQSSESTDKQRGKELKQLLKTNPSAETNKILCSHLRNNSTLGEKSLDSFLLQAVLDHAQLLGIIGLYDLRNQEDRLRLRTSIIGEIPLHAMPTSSS